MPTNNQTKWTPGPWFHGELFENAEGAFYGIGNGATAIALVRSSAITKGDEAQANARLIALAPELADALRNALSFCQCEAMLDRTTFARVDWTTLRDAARLRAEQINAILARLEGEK